MHKRGTLKSNEELFAELHRPINFKKEKFGNTLRIIIQLTKLLLLQPKVTLIAKDFFTMRDDYDEFIIELIEKNMEDGCVIAILENLDVLSHFDKVVVMDRGTVKETGAVQDLVSDPSSWLNKVAEKKQQVDPDLTTRLRNTVEVKLPK